MSTLAQVVIPVVRQVVKTSSLDDLSDTQILSYLNRFVINYFPAAIEVFDLKTTYEFVTAPYIDKYNVPIDEYTFYNGPLLINGIPEAWIQSPSQWIAFSNPNRTSVTLGQGDGTSVTFNYNLYSTIVTPPPTVQPFIRAHYTWNQEWTLGVKITTLDANQNQLEVSDGVYLPAVPLPNANTGWLTEDGTTAIGQVNYVTGDISVTFSVPPGSGEDINISVLFFSPGMPSGAFLYDNYIQLYPVPNTAFTVSVVAQKNFANYSSTSDSLQYIWMADYLAYGTARLILTDVGDVTQFQFYEPLYKEQERYVLRRTSRQNATQRVYTPFAAQVEPKIDAPFGAWRWF